MGLVVVARRCKRQDVNHDGAVASGVAKSSLRLNPGTAVLAPAGARFAGPLLLRSCVLFRLPVWDVFQPGDRVAVLVSRFRIALCAAACAPALVAAAAGRDDS